MVSRYQFQSRNRETFDSNLDQRIGWHLEISSFNLVIEKLLIPTLFVKHSPQQLFAHPFQSRNRETFDSNPKCLTHASLALFLFQSRNRETFDSNFCLSILSVCKSRGFNLVIEKLLIPTHLEHSLFQSPRNF